MYVCLSQTYEICLFRRVSNSLSKAFKILRLFYFFRIVRGGTSRSLAGVKTCMYVCLSTRRTLSRYVCMSDRPKQLCMYVCMSEAPEHVCMYVSLKATKSACFGGCQTPYQNLQNLMFNSFFFEL